MMRYDILVKGTNPNGDQVLRKVNRRPLVRKWAKRLFDSMSVRAVVAQSRVSWLPDRGTRLRKVALGIVDENEKPLASFA